MFVAWGISESLTNRTFLTCAGAHDQAVARVHKMLQFAGGVDTASDLVELYSRVGYDQLVPAYAKHNWSWIIYYSYDCYMFIILVTCFFSYFVYRCTCSYFLT